MTGKFINTTHSDNINQLVNGLQNIIKNPYYKWNNQSPTVVTYYNQNTEMSTLDEGSKLQYSALGDDSPTYYNEIKDFYLYGIERATLQVDNGEFGTESDTIEGEAIILPNTITPYPGDYFKINYIKENMLFRVTSVTPDTLEDGANIWKVSYKIDSSLDHDKDLNIKDSYNMILNNTGTKFNSIIRSEKFDLIKELENNLICLKEYYKNIFYSDRVQSFIFIHNTKHFYDPNMIEFIIRNGLMDGGENFIFVSHILPLPSTFSIDYKNTFFRYLEKFDFDNLYKYRYNAIGRIIDNDTTIFSTRPEEYFSIDFNYNTVETSLFGVLPCFHDDFIVHLSQSKIFENDDPLAVYNIIIKLANKINITQNDLDVLDNIELNNNITLFYSIPCIIFCIEAFIKQLMIDDNSINPKTSI